MCDAAAAASLFSDSYEEDDVSEFSRTESDANKKVIQITKDYLVKLSLSESADHDKREQYRAHVQSMLLLGDGETIIELGVGIDDTADRGLSKRDLDLSERNHKALLKRFDAISTRIVINQRGNLYTNVQLVRVEKGPDDFIEVRIAVIGNVDAGKSTLLGVLTHDALDDGRGHARQKLFRHKHEFESGRTSSVSNDILGFDSKGNVVNKPDVHTGRLDWATICRDSTKVITFIDLAGHEKYLKTTIFGITGHAPDYAMLMVGGNAGITGMTKEHLSLALSLNIPVFVVVTKIDMCPEQVLSETMKNLEKLMKSPGVRKISFAVRTLEDVARAAIHFSDGKVCPIFQLSNVVGTNLNLLRTFLNLIPFHRKFNIDCPAEFQVDDVFWVDGVGTVVSGTCLAGIISINDVMMLGPNQIGGFISVPIKSIQRKRLPVSMIHAGQTASFSIRKVNKKEVRKGMVLLSPDIEICSSIQFEAEILILHHSTTIIKNYQAMVHIGSVRQTATVIDMRKPLLRSGDRDLVTLKFIRYPEYIRVGSRVVFREGRSKAVGTVTRVFPYIHPMCAAKQSQPKGTKHPGGWKGKKSGDGGSRKGGSVDRKESSVSITTNGDTKDLCSAKSTDRK